MSSEMAQAGVELETETFSCSICLEPLKDPVSLCCGHSFCMSCINSHWDSEDEKMTYSCPQCRRIYTPRPELMKNTMLADLVEKLKKSGLAAAPADHCFAGAGDVACDFCTGRKLRARKSCLVCLASYCEKHLQPHYQSPAFKKHKLVEPFKNCPHNKTTDMFCRDHQQCICFLCSVGEHKDHDVVSAAEERVQKQREIEPALKQVQKRLQHRDQDVKLLHDEVKALTVSADKAVEDTEEILIEMMHDLQKRAADVKQQIRSKQEAEVRRVRDVEAKLQREISELKKREEELLQLSLIQDHNQFLLNYTSLPALGPSTHSLSINGQPRRYFEDVTEAVAKVRGQLQEDLTETWRNVSLMVTQLDVLLPQPEPTSRAEFFRYSQELTLDPNTVSKRLLLSEGNRRVTFMKDRQLYSGHPDRFTGYNQVLSREGLTRRCYWEVEWRGGAEGGGGGGGVYVAVTYKTITRSGSSTECLFGFNDKSWALDCNQNGCSFYHKGVKTEVSGCLTSRVGVYLDQSVGLLSFYRVSKTMTLLHRVHTDFTQPLHAGLCFYGVVVSPSPGDTAEFCKLK